MRREREVLCLTHVCQTGMKERCVNVLVLKIEWETAKITAALMNHPKKAGGTKVTVLKTDG